jgi:hypothetical protein
MTVNYATEQSQENNRHFIKEDKKCSLWRLRVKSLARYERIIFSPQWSSISEGQSLDQYVMDELNV